MSINEETVHVCDEHRERVRAALSNMPDDDELIELAELFRLFGDSTRIRILYVLMQGELCVCDIAQSLNVSVSAVSHQLRLLKQARLVKYRREGKSLVYALSDDHVRQIIDIGLIHIEE